MKWLKRIVILLLAVLIVAGAAAAYLVATFDPNDYKDRISAAVKEQTGRDLVIEGDIGLTFFPRIGLALGETRLSNAPGFATEPFARIGEVELSVALMPLLRRELQVDRVRLDGLTLNLERDADGRTNWDDLVGDADADEVAEPRDGRGPGLRDLDIGGVVIRDARVSWRDAQAGTGILLDPLNLELGRVRLGEETPLELSMRLHQDDPALTLALDLKSRVTVNPLEGQYRLRRLAAAADIDGDAFPADLSIALETDLDVDLSAGTATLERVGLELLGARFDGAVRVAGLDGDTPVVQGELSSNTFNLRTLLEGLGQTAPATADPAALQRASLELIFEADPDRADISRLTARLDDTRLEGQVGVSDFSQPRIRAELAVDGMDVDRYLPGPEPGSGAPAGDTDAPSGDPGELPLEFLRSLDVETRVTVGQLKVQGLELADIQVSLSGRNGVFEVDPLTATLSGSQLQAGLRLDVRGEQPRAAGTLRTGVFDARALAEHLGDAPLDTADPEVLKRVALDLDFTADMDSAAISRMDLRVDDSRLRGNAGIRNFERPAVQVELEVDRVNLDRYLPPPDEAPAGGTAASGEAFELPVDMLRDMNINGRLAVGELVIRGLNLSGIQLALRARDGRLELQPANMRVSGGDVQANLTLDVSGEQPAFSGALRTGVFNLREVLENLNGAPPETADPEVLKRVSMDLAFDGGMEHVNLSRLDVRLDDSRLRGNAGARVVERMAIRADLNVDRIDLDRYLPPPTEGPSPEAPARQGWSDEPLDLPVDMLRELDVEARLALGELVLNRLRFSNLNLPLTAREGVVAISPFEGRLYQGSIEAALNLDVRGEQPRIEFEPALRDVHMGPLLDDLFEGDGKLAGTTLMVARIALEGGSVKQMVSSLDGEAEFKLTDGAVKGINIAQVIRDAEARFRGRTPEPRDEPNQTDFSELAGSVRINAGVVSNEDLRASSPLLRVNGRGTADLPREQVDYRVDATLVATLEGQGGRSLDELRGLNLPIRVRGPFHDLSFGLDLRPVLEGRVREELDRRLEDSVQPRIDEQRERLEERLRDLLPRSR